MFNIVNNQFQQFYDFAQARKLEGNNTAIAKLGDDVPTISRPGSTCRSWS